MAGVWARLHRVLLERLADDEHLDWSRAALDSSTVAAKKRAPRPGRTRRIAAKRARSATLWSTATVPPLGVRLSPASRHNSLMLASILYAVQGVRHGRGRPRKRPEKLHADKVYDHRRCRAECRARSITPCIARRGVDSRERLGRHRWVVERSLAWLNRFRRLAIRYERRADIHEAFTTLGCALICLNQIRRLC
jgi:transposase